MNDKIIKVTDPTSDSESLSRIFEDFDYAYNKVNELYDDLKSGKISLLSRKDEEFNILYNTASYQVKLARERHQTDEPVTDFQRKSMRQKFNWDERAVAYDKGNRKAQGMFHKLKFLSTGKESTPVDPEELLSLQDKVQSQVDDLKKDQEQQLDYIQNKQKDEKDYTKAEIQSMMDIALDNEDYQELDRIRTNPNFSWFFEDGNQLSEEITRIKSLMKKIIL
jgi:hypothetical protein